MVKKTTKIFIELIAGLIAGMVILCALGLWFLSKGPLNINYLTAVIEDNINNNQDLIDIDIAGLSLVWRGGGKLSNITAIDIIARDVVVEQKHGTGSAFLPKTILGVSFKALARGEISLKNLKIISPELNIIKKYDDSLNFNSAETVTNDMILRNNEILAIYKMIFNGEIFKTTLPYLNNLYVENANIKFIDQDKNIDWYFPDAGFEINILDGKTTSSLKANLSINGDDDYSNIDINHIYAENNMRLDIKIANGKLNLQDIIPDINKQYLHIKSADITISADDNLTNIAVEKAKIDIGDANISLKGKINQKTNMHDVTLSANINGFNLENLDDYWPNNLAIDARNWVVKNIAYGNIENANINIGGILHNNINNDVDSDFTFGQFHIGSIGGEIIGNHIRVNYLSPMPVATNVDARIKFGNDWLEIYIKKANAGNIKLDNGYIKISNIGKSDDFISSLNLLGPMEEFLVHLDKKPLMFLDMVGFKREGVSGDGNVNLELKFPLMNDLSKKQIKVELKADIFNVKLPNIHNGQMAVAEKLSLDVNNERMNINGRINSVNSIFDIKLQENFSDFSKIKNKIIIDTIMDKQALSHMGVDIGDDNDGNFKLNLNLIQMRDGNRILTGDIDLIDADINIPLINWHKPVGQAAILELNSTISTSGKIDINSLKVKSDNFKFDGKMILSNINGDMDYNIDKLTIYNLKTNDNDILGVIIKTVNNGFDVKLSGSKFDVAGIKEFYKKSITDTKDAIVKNPYGKVKIAADFDILTDGKESQLKNVKLNILYDNDKMAMFNLNSFAGDAPFNIEYGKFGDDGNQLLIKSSDAGAVLDQLDISSKISGGKMEITASRNSHDQPLSGKISIGEFTLIKAPAIAKILEFMSLTGIASALGGQGLLFDSLNADFKYDDGVVDIKDGLSFGNSIGITAYGKIDIEHKEYAMKGTLAPAYSLSRAVSWLPILGKIISGDEGIFAARYSIVGPINDPDLSINPISILTPGILRNIFNIFESENILSRSKPK